ncbi:MAG: TrmB family transcriptional regulator [Nanoarchaeota archaeon]
MEIEATLNEIGLNDDEIKIYICLLKKNSQLASDISRNTKINRSHVYQLLERLIAKGFVSYIIKNNKKYFNSINPEKILEIIKEKENKLKLVMPQLLDLSCSSSLKPKVEILEGKEGIKTILNEILRLNKNWFAFGSSGMAPEILPYYVEAWEKQREKRKISLKAILDISEQGRKRGKELSKLKYTQIKHIASENSNPSSIWGYGDRIVFIIWNKENSFAIRIISEEILEKYVGYFNLLWKSAKA